MRILIVDGWTRDGNRSHAHAGVKEQAHVFKSLVRECQPEAEIRIVDTHVVAGPTDLDFSGYDAAVWTGGGGNIYKVDPFNRRQLELGERVLSEVPRVWGSCWGFQVITTVCGGEVAPARRPEMGIAAGISVRSMDFAETLYRGKPRPFDAPAHHFDETARLPREFEIVAENATTLQAVVSKDRRITCTQYHPELPYDYIAKLMLHWAPNYTSIFAEDDFRNLLAGLKKKEKEEKSFRKIEFRNWLGYVRRGG
ncbi:MAG: hypothetical protein OXU79_15775 [Gemmatimonadota bacterium]|nr:hypothetical protein [Gemmatimonadota bacterium]